MKRFKIVVIVSLLALLSLITIQYFTIKTNLQYTNDIESMSLHEQKVGQTYIVLNLMLNIETGSRGFLLTKLPTFLEPYNDAIKILPSELAKLNTYLNDSDKNELASLIKLRVQHASAIIEKIKKNQKILPADLVPGKMAMDQIRKLISTILEKENKVIVGISRQPGKMIAVGFIGGSFLSLTFMGICIFYLISEFKKRSLIEKNLQVSLATSEAISRDIGIGIIACDTLGNVLFANKWVLAQVSKLTVIDDFFSSNPLMEIPLKKLLIGDINSITEMELNLKNQRKIVTVNASTFQVQDDLKGTILSIIDTTDSTQKMATLVSSKQMADLASKAKSDFLAKMSHEIRTPLNAILGVGEILSLSRLDKEQGRCLEIFKRSAVTLNNLVNDILDLTKIEAGKIDLIEAPFSLKNLVNSSASLMDFRASQKGLLFSVETKSNFDHFIGDEGRIRQVILNLLSNAIKFTEYGEVKFTIQCEDKGDKKELLFIVKDSGRGISSENMEKLFSEYQQENSQIAQEFGGTGLGLSLSRELSRLMGGDIYFKSEISKGSEFTFRICLSLADGKYIEEVIDENFKFNKLKILLVDDNHENRFIIKKYLNDFNIEIIEAVDGNDALQTFKSDKFDLVLMDINMPKKDGLSATKEIREMEQLKQIEKTFIIALSANAMSMEYANALSAGCDDYLTKPISRVRLITMIKKWVGDGGESHESNTIVDIDNDEEIDEDIKALIPAYLISRQKDIGTIKEAFIKKDMVVIAKLIHNIKGTAISYGQVELDKIAKEVELSLHSNELEKVETLIGEMERLLSKNDGH